MEGRNEGPAKNHLQSPTTADGGGGGGGDGDGDDFTFAVPAADGRVCTVYPIFGRPQSPPSPEHEPQRATTRVPLGRLLLQEQSSSAWPPVDDGGGGGEDELDGVPPETYCLWAPGSSAPGSPAQCRKSGSTGSVLRWRRISERLIGRSHSDGKEKFVFLNTATGGEHKAEKGKKGGSGGDGWSYYYGKGRAAGNGSRKSTSTYLPYKQELVGLFANVSGLRRSYHPF